MNCRSSIITTPIDEIINLVVESLSHEGEGGEEMENKIEQDRKWRTINRNPSVVVWLA